MTSLWLADRVVAPMTARTGLEDGARAEVIVVGAGITGLITAVLLARAGKDVLVLESDAIGAGASGNTTGKISLLQGTKLSKIIANHGPELAAQYVAGGLEGQQWILRHCRRHDVAVQHEDAYTYAQTLGGIPAARAELAAAELAGLSVEWADDADVPFPYRGGVRLREQAQFDPMPFLESLVAQLLAHGGRLALGARALGASCTGDLLRVRAHTSEAGELTVYGRKLVLATGTPILDRGAFFARLRAERSYCLAFTVPGNITRPMFLSADAPTHSIRHAPTAAGDVLIVGGASHPVGRRKTPSQAVAELAQWTEQHYPGAVQTHSWSAQDYAPVGNLPYVGPILPGSENVLIATGFDKWGLSTGAAGALALSSRILGGRMDWAAAFASWSPHQMMSGIGTMVRTNLDVGLRLAKGWLTPIAAPRHFTAPGCGLVSGAPWHLRARSRIDGTEQVVSPVCPHLGGIVQWNDADQTWECPLHGSRFAPDGRRLEGPATADLTPFGDGAAWADGFNHADSGHS